MSVAKNKHRRRFASLYVYGIKHTHAIYFDTFIRTCCGQYANMDVAQGLWCDNQHTQSRHTLTPAAAAGL
jgi:hypothetical protein